MSTDLRAAGLCPTLITIGQSGIIQLIPPSKCAGMFLKYASGGSLAITGGASLGVATGYVLGSTDISIDGPATFYLAAGVTSVASVVFKMSAGFSQTVG
jgi:hypothetical protein